MIFQTTAAIFSVILLNSSPLGTYRRTKSLAFSLFPLCQVGSVSAKYSDGPVFFALAKTCKLVAVIQLERVPTAAGNALEDVAHGIGFRLIVQGLVNSNGGGGGDEAGSCYACDNSILPLPFGCVQLCSGSTARRVNHR